MLRVHKEIPDPQTDEDLENLQISLAREVRLGDQFRNVAGVDVAYSKDGKWAYAAAVVLSTTNWQVVHSQKAKLHVTRPYKSGTLSFREGPLVVEVLRRLAVVPDVILTDGNGTAHPRRFGLACYVGLTFDHPTVGVAKTWPRGCIKAETSSQLKRGAKQALLAEQGRDRLGYELVTQDATQPIYVSPGHRVSNEEAVSVVLRCSPWYKNPEPLRHADQLANAFRAEDIGE